MDIIKHFKDLKNNIIADSANEIDSIKQKVLIDVAAKHQEVEKIKSETLKRLHLDFVNNRDEQVRVHGKVLNELQETYQNNIAQVEELAVKQKQEILEQALLVATLTITSERDSAVQELDKLIAKHEKKER
jgi:hypothetical protein